MSLGLLGLKVGMTQVFNEEGRIIPVTLIRVGPCPVLQIRNQENDGYDAVQLGFLDKPRRVSIRSERGHVSSKLESKRRKARQEGGVALLPKAETEPQRHVREFRLTEPATLEVGKTLTVDEIFKDVKAVDVIGTTKGRGYTGSMKRHNFAGLPASHGAKKVHRSIGSGASLASNRGGGRPKKGRKMDGRYGGERVTIRNLKVVRIDAEENLLLIEGAVPGANTGLLLVRPTNKRTKADSKAKK